MASTISIVFVLLQLASIDMNWVRIQMSGISHDRKPNFLPMCIFINNLFIYLNLVFLQSFIFFIQMNVINSFSYLRYINEWKKWNLKTRKEKNYAELTFNRNTFWLLEYCKEI